MVGAFLVVLTLTDAKKERCPCGWQGKIIKWWLLMWGVLIRIWARGILTRCVLLRRDDLIRWCCVVSLFYKGETLLCSKPCRWYYVGIEKSSKLMKKCKDARKTEPNGLGVTPLSVRQKSRLLPQCKSEKIGIWIRVIPFAEN